MCLQKMTLSAAKAGGLLSPPAARFPRAQLHSPGWAFPSVPAPRGGNTPALRLDWLLTVGAGTKGNVIL